MPLLLTKLFIPKMSGNHIRREKLLNKLSGGYDAGNQLTLMCAPAGYGKSTAVLEFLDAIDADAAWISLDEGDNDTQRFLAYLVAALRKAGVTVGNDIDPLITDIGIHKTETVLTMLVNDIALCGNRIILALDDYHAIRGQKVNDVLKFLLDHQPPNLHIIIISREDPQLPLARLRMKGRLTELRLEDLQFTLEEAAELFGKSIDITLTDEAVRKLNERTEGWIASLQLATLLLRNCRRDQFDEYINNFDGTNRYIIDYLVEEVLERLTPDVRDFLRKTSVLDRMNEGLCNELTGRSDARDTLQRINKANLFLIPLDEKREWYRYHHLFASSIKTGLTGDEEKEQNRRSAIWMKNNGFSYEAVKYAFKSGDTSLALSVVEGSVIEAFQNAQLESLVAWIGMLPEEEVRKSEVLSVRKAIAFFIVGRTNDAIEYMVTLDGEFEQNASLHNKGLLYYLRAMAAALSGQDVEPLAREALQFLQPWDPIARTSAMNSLGRAQFAKGQASEAAKTFKNAYEEGLKIGYQFVTTLALMNYSSCLQAMGRGKEALSLCEQYIEEMRSRFDKLPLFAGVLYVAMAGFYESNNDLEKARLYRAEGLALCKSISFDAEAYLEVFGNIEHSGRPVEKAGVAINGETMSERETEVLMLLGKGFPNQKIAESLYISVNTVQWHISHIYGKLGVRNRTQAVLKAKEIGIL